MPSKAGITGRESEHDPVTGSLYLLFYRDGHRRDIWRVIPRCIHLHGTPGGYSRRPHDRCLHGLQVL